MDRKEKFQLKHEEGHWALSVPPNRHYKAFDVKAKHNGLWKMNRGYAGLSCLLY
jgi:hypothetical protein